MPSVALIRKSQNVLHVCYSMAAFIGMPICMAIAWILYAQAQGIVVGVELPLALIAVCGVAAAYCLDRLVDPDERLRDVYRFGLKHALSYTALFAVAMAVILWAVYGFQHLHWIGLCVLSAAVHQYANGTPLAKTWSVSLAWLCACFLLPAQFHLLDLAMMTHMALWFCMFAISCVLCDFKDEDRDRSLGVQSLVVLIGAEKAIHCLRVLLLACLVLAACLQLWALALLSVLLISCTYYQRILLHPLWAPFVVDALIVFSALCGVYVFC